MGVADYTLELRNANEALLKENGGLEGFSYVVVGQEIKNDLLRERYSRSSMAAPTVSRNSDRPLGLRSDFHTASRQHIDAFRHQAGPSRLMTSADARPVITMEVFVKQE